MIKPKEINVLIACEESQTECNAFRAMGFNAYSCDIQRCSGNNPYRHIVGDVRELFLTPCAFNTEAGYCKTIDQWHLIIAHPPCTYLSKVSASNCVGGLALDEKRQQQGWEAASFFYEMLNAPAPFVAVENPVPLRFYNLPRPTTYVEPFWFGQPYSKKTCLWLKNLPPLMPTQIVPHHKPWVYQCHDGKRRSKSFAGIAEAMAKQWGQYVLDMMNK